MGSKWLKVACAALALYAAGYTGYNEVKKGELQDTIFFKDKQHNQEISNIVDEYAKLADKHNNLQEFVSSNIKRFNNLQEFVSLGNKQHNQEISNIVDKYTNLINEYNKLKDFVDTQFKKDGKYDFSNKLLNDEQYNEFLKNLEASTEKIIKKGVYERILLDGTIERIEPAARGTGLVLYIDKKTNKTIILTAGHVAEPLPNTIGDWWTTTTYEKKSEDLYIQKGDVKISLKVLAHHKNKDFALLETDGGINFTEIPYKIGKSKELEKGNYLAFYGYPMGEDVESPSFGWVRNTTGYGNAVNSGLIESSTYQILLSNPTIPGDSGSAIFALRDGVPELVGFIHAGYLAAQGMNCGVHIDEVVALIQYHGVPAEKFR